MEKEIPYNLKYPRPRDFLNNKLVNELENFGKELGNLHHINIWQARKEGKSLPKNSLVFVTIKDVNQWAEHPNYVEGVIKDQQITIFSVDKDGSASVILSIDVEINFDDQGKPTGIKDKPKIFDSMTTNKKNCYVSMEDFLDFLSILSEQIKLGKNIEKIKYDPETKESFEYK